MLGRTVLGLLALSASSLAEARTVVEASDAQDLSVTIYRDPNRGEFERMNPGWPEGFAMISETRTVTLPPGESTIRFTGVAEGMVAVTAIVSGLPGGVIEKNRNAQLLSPAALVDGTLGNRVTITRTDPATGTAQSESAIVRTRADGGLVLQTGDGFEAVRCSGLPEKLTFDRVPDGLSASPVFSVDTRDESGGTYQVTLTYLSAGFDWQAQYVGHFTETGLGEQRKLRLMAWLTLANDNGQSFADAQLMTVAGRLNVESDYRGMADPPEAEPLRLTCFPIGSTAAGSKLPPPPPPPAPPPPPMAMEMADSIVLTASRGAAKAQMAPAMVATEEDLGDLKLYRVPERVTVSAKGQKQVAFLSKEEVTGEFVYELRCVPRAEPVAAPLGITLRTKNDEKHGLGVALPAGQLTLFEPSSIGEQLVGEDNLRDYAEGQDIELEIATSSQVQGACGLAGDDIDWSDRRRWHESKVLITNANPEAVTVRIWLGEAGNWSFRKTPGKTRLKDGWQVVELTIPANGSRELEWDLRPAT